MIILQDLNSIRQERIHVNQIRACTCTVHVTRPFAIPGEIRRVLLYLKRSKTRTFIQCPGPLTHAFDQCYFSIHLSVTWTGNHRNVSIIFSYNPRISPAPQARTGVTRSYLIYVLLHPYNDNKRHHITYILTKTLDTGEFPKGKDVSGVIPMLYGSSPLSTVL